MKTDKKVIMLTQDPKGLSERPPGGVYLLKGLNQKASA